MTYNFKSKESLYRKALRLLMNHTEDSFTPQSITSALVAVACFNSLEANEKAKESVDFDAFCDTVVDIWLDCEDRTCVCSISDWVAEYAAETGELPGDSFYDLAVWAVNKGLL